MIDAVSTARKMALNLLELYPQPTGDNIQTAVHQAVAAVCGMSKIDHLDEGAVLREVEAACNVWVPEPIALEDSREHQDWLSRRRPEIEWNFWNRYRRYLLEVKEFAPESLRRLNEATDDVLKRLEDPGRPGAWDRRGMVVGQVQSGKTSNYIGLICKAADAGYRLIIVLAGAHNSLRSQTQLRLDEGFLGFDTQQRREYDQSNARIGVGKLPGEKFFIAHSLTSSRERGDFNVQVAESANVTIGGSEPVLLVVKKNQSVLRNLIQWATKTRGETDPRTGLKAVRGIPLLVIDDEADYASVNTRDADSDPTKINGQIRELLRTFEQSAYVGYTATPFANIFIPLYQDADTSKYGEDLFPRSFIINLPPPSNYMGPVRVFGLAADAPAGVEEQPAWPLVRLVDDFEDWIPNNHKNGYHPGPLPASLRQAMQAFLLVCAARAAREQTNEHNSMLVHVTRFTQVQREVADQIRDELGRLKERIRYGDGNYPEKLIDELRWLWDKDFTPTTRAFDDPALPPLVFDELIPFLSPTSEKIEILVVNGTARDALAYYEHRHEGLSCIVIGGDKLSRGLTLEGLSVSYYLRASRMYDTLMQMGRWFGYRPGYADLCRLYTTRELAGWYRDITAADEELRREFDYMAQIQATPEDYGLRVRSHPDGLMVTAAAKMRHAAHIEISFSGTIAETIAFHNDRPTITANFESASALLDALGPVAPPGDRDPGLPIWRTGDPGDVITFLQNYRTHPDARKVQTPLLVRYIQQRLAAGELTEWVVALASGNSRTARIIAGQRIQPVERSDLNEASGGESYRIRRLVSPRDEAADLSGNEYELALRLTRESWARDRGRSQRETAPDLPSGLIIRRRVRPATRGLLLIYPLDPEKAGLPPDFPPITGIALSFPWSEAQDSAVEYTVNNVYWQQEFGEL